MSSLASAAEALRAEGSSVMYLGRDRRLIGLVAVSDPIRASARGALQALREPGLRLVMATGDGLTTARAVAKRRRERRAVAPATPPQPRPPHSCAPSQQIPRA